MYQISTLSNSPPSPQYFSPSQSSHIRHSVASFDSRNSAENDDSPMNRPTLHQILLNQGRGQYTLDNFGACVANDLKYVFERRSLLIDSS
ncbi:hypothetical protein BGZ49_010403 [Haplosporangium sp. Z 27]|nr:hypothetical protein BGZ49_010403 [Haplosporangium sp. Z 27]